MYGVGCKLYEMRRATRTRVDSITVVILPRKVNAIVYRKDEDGYCHARSYAGISMSSFDRIVFVAKSQTVKKSQGKRKQ